MKLTCIFVVFCVGAAALPKTLLSDAFTTISFEALGQVRSDSVNFPNANKAIVGTFDLKVESGTDPNIDFWTAGETVTSPHGTAQGTITASANANFFSHFIGQPGAGKLGVSYTASLLAENPGFGQQGDIQFANAEFREINIRAAIGDQIVVTIPNYPLGYPYIVTGNFQLSGSLAPAVSGTPRSGSSANAEAWVKLNGHGSTLPNPIYLDQYYGWARATLNRNQETFESHEPLRSVPYVFQVISGQSYELGLDLEIGGMGSVDRGSNAPTIGPGKAFSQIYADFSQTLTWGGIQSVTNALTGEPVQNWTITSESGFDYSRSYIIPEPNGVSLLSLTICNATWLRRRRCKSTTEEKKRGQA